jgi:hypothetical protein
MSSCSVTARGVFPVSVVELRLDAWDVKKERRRRTGKKAAMICWKYDRG